MAAFVANAQVDTTNANTDPSNSQYQTPDASSDYTEKEAVAMSELPELVKETLTSPDFAGWTAGNAYRKEKDGKTFYAVEMTKGTEKKMVKFDAQGNKIKEKDKDMKK